MRSIDVFSGAGGLALGVHRAGFRHLAVIEADFHASGSLRLNRTRCHATGIDWPIHEVDVRAFDYAPYGEDIDLLAAGAPCQPFSLGGKHLGADDPQNMFPEVFRAVRELRPRAFLLENVKGLTRAAFRPYFAYIVLHLKFPHVPQSSSETWDEHNARLAVHRAISETKNSHCHLPFRRRYDVKVKVLDVADFGIPQRRQRVFLVGFRLDLGIQWDFPTATHSRDALLYAQYVDGSYWLEHGLAPRPAPDNLKTRVAALAMSPRPTERRWRTVRDAIGDLPAPIDHDPTPPIDSHVGIPDARIYHGHDGSPWDWPAKTLKAGGHGNPGGENMLRREDGSVRYFTVREMARLQTFPDEWWFAGPRSASRRQLGNAVPVEIAEFLAGRVREELERVDRGLASRP